MIIPVWRKYAECRDKPVMWFFDGDLIELALRLCKRCGVREKCLQFAIDERIEDGIWGGKREYELKRMVRKRAALRGASQGTDSAVRAGGLRQNAELLDGGEAVVSDPFPVNCLCGGFGLCRGENDARVS